MKTTLIIEINSHPYNEYVIQTTSIEVCEMQTVLCPECPRCNTFWTEDKKQFNLDY